MATTIPERYRVVDSLGSGGAGEVYAVEDQQTGQKRALKILKAGQPYRIVDSFAREFLALKPLHHPNLPELHEFAWHDGAPYFTLDMVDGENFVDYVAENTEEVWRLLYQMVNALRYLHEQGTLHLDIKPDNILVREKPLEGGTLAIPTLIDFGLAHQYRTDMHPGVVGTARYVAPEIVTGDPLGPETDYYSLGAVIFEMLEGEPPFTGKMRDVLRAHVTETPRFTHRAAEYESLHQIAEGLLAKKPADRRDFFDRLYREAYGYAAGGHPDIDRDVALAEIATFYDAVAFDAAARICSATAGIVLVVVSEDEMRDHVSTAIRDWCSVSQAQMIAVFDWVAQGDVGRDELVRQLSASLTSDEAGQFFVLCGSEEQRRDVTKRAAIPESRTATDSVEAPELDSFLDNMVLSSANLDSKDGIVQELSGAVGREGLGRAIRRWIAAGRLITNRNVWTIDNTVSAPPRITEQIEWTTLSDPERRVVEWLFLMSGRASDGALGEFADIINVSNAELVVDGLALKGVLQRRRGRMFLRQKVTLSELSDDGRAMAGKMLTHLEHSRPTERLIEWGHSVCVAALACGDTDKFFRFAGSVLDELLSDLKLEAARSFGRSVLTHYRGADVDHRKLLDKWLSKKIVRASLLTGELTEPIADVESYCERYQTHVPPSWIVPYARGLLRTAAKGKSAKLKEELSGVPDWAPWRTRKVITEHVSRAVDSGAVYIDLIERLLETVPESDVLPYAYARLLELVHYSDVGDNEKLAEIFNRPEPSDSVRRTAEYMSSLLARGYYYLDEFRYEDCLLVANDLVNLWPGCFKTSRAQGYFLESAVHYERGEYESAIEDLEKALHIATGVREISTSELLLRQVMNHQCLGYFEGAKEFLERTFEALLPNESHTRAEAYIARVELLYTLGHNVPEGLIRKMWDVVKVAEVERFVAYAYVREAECRALDGQPDHALRLYELALGRSQTYPKDDYTRYLLQYGVHAFKAGYVDKAERAISEAKYNVDNPSSSVRFWLLFLQALLEGGGHLLDLYDEASAQADAMLRLYGLGTCVDYGSNELVARARGAFVETMRMVLSHTNEGDADRLLELHAYRRRTEGSWSD